MKIVDETKFPEPGDKYTSGFESDYRLPDGTYDILEEEKSEVITQCCGAIVDNKGRTGFSVVTVDQFGNKCGNDCFWSEKLNCWVYALEED